MADPTNISELRGLLRSLDAAIENADAAALLDSASARELSRFLENILKTTARMQGLADQIDPVRQPLVVLDPSDPRQMGVLIGNALEDVTPVPLASVGKFYGSGVYALYYSGDFPAYGAIRKTRVPIYVGKADPDLPTAKNPREQGARVSSRLSEHAKTIGRAGNLDIAEFTCRFLVIQSGFQSAAEEYLIRRYHPVWNKEVKVCPGFGKHGDTARTELSPWDVIHSGRAWAAQQESRSGRTAKTVSKAIEAHFRNLLNAEPDLWRPAFEKSWVKAVDG